MSRFSSRLIGGISGVFLTLSLLSFVGCGDDTDLVRDIQNRRQDRAQERSQQDHLGEVFALLQQYVDLEPDRAKRQIAYHLNRWSESREEVNAEPTSLVKTLREVFSLEELTKQLTNQTFQATDTQHLRDCFLFSQLYGWIDTPNLDDPLLEAWFAEKEKDWEPADVDTLRTATRLFDWTVRNVALEYDIPASPAPPGPSFSFGMKFRGAGYRQTDYQTAMRGIGDALQRAGVFTQLCRQAGITAAVLATIDGQTGELKPFCIGVLVADELYLFEPKLGIFVPGPGQVGIATLSEARRDALVLRRLGIAGLDQFTYKTTKSDVQQCAALINVLPEAVALRMKKLQGGLTGNRRMVVYVDADQMAAQLDAVTGISSVRLWDVPVLAEIYKATCDAHAERDPLFAFWYVARWAMMESDVENSENLARGRWLHLLGQFTDDEDESVRGARTLYLSQRAPEFEIEDLRINVDLQQAYGIRRELGTDSADYERQVAQIQGFIRMGKRTATYWLSLLQADDGRRETAEGWIAKRVLDEKQQSFWIPSARYNLARLAESLGQTERALELYKREGEPQEHGNRIRARLLSRAKSE
ncbi:MAG: hypothetical protein AAF802_17670 [Planctomycetota bacterium]